MWQRWRQRSSLLSQRSMRRCAAGIRICRFYQDKIGLEAKFSSNSWSFWPSCASTALEGNEDKMKDILRIATPLIAVALMSGAPLFAHAQNNQAPTTENRSWNTPPPGTEQAQAAYRDGIDAAKLDMTAKRKIDAKSSHLYVHPPVKGAARDEYRSNFTVGYE